MNVFLKILSLLFFLIVQTIVAQKSTPDTISAFGTNEKIKLDGILDEKCWSEALKINNFTQRELHQGEPATEKTEVAIVYTEHFLYVGIWCYDSNPQKINAKYLDRDFDFGSDDNFEMILDPFHDHRNGYLFVINPLGARADALIANEGDFVNSDWNGVWDAATQINDNGWFAEIMIPFSTLQFPPSGEQNWGINFERNIRRNLEQVLWQGWSRNYQLKTISQAGVLSGIKNVKGKLRWELKPYVNMGVQQNQQKSAGFFNKGGLDINKNLSSTLKLNLTFNTDFAQVEADNIQVNLSRFSLYYPEKRDIFLEGAGNYQLYIGEGNQAFYSRKIGISNFRQIPILAGARVFGKVSNLDVRMFSIQTGEKDSIPSTNYSMLRIKKDIAGQSYIGIISTSKINSSESNQMYGFDGRYATSKMFKNKNLFIGGALLQSYTKGSPQQKNMAYRFYLDFPNDLIDNFIGVATVQKNFIPELGFIGRSNAQVLSWSFTFMPRWVESWGVRKLYFKPWDFSLFFNEQTHRLESYYNEVRPFGFITKSGEWMELNLQQGFDAPPDSFEISNGIIIPPGNYYTNSYEVQWGTFRGRRCFAEIMYNTGSFYAGQKQTWYNSIGVNLNKHLNVSAEWIYNDVKLPQGSIFTNELSGNIQFSFTTKLSSSLFMQWNSEAEFTGFNFRIHWIPKIGSDFFVVFNQTYEPKHILKIPNQTTGIAKLVWRIAI